MDNKLQITIDALKAIYELEKQDRITRPLDNEFIDSNPKSHIEAISEEALLQIGENNGK